MQKAKIVTREIDLNGRKLKLETGYLAQAADGAVLATWGETVVLVTVAVKTLLEDMGYFPLSVEYVEKYYAGGIITSQKFIKRETRPQDEAVLAGRAIDRAIRPLFPKDFNSSEVQVIINVLSYDGENDPVTLGFIATSAALTISSVPWDGPLGVARIGKIQNEIKVNPLISEMKDFEMDLLVASTKDKVVMIEDESKEVKDEEIFENIKKAHAEAQTIIDLINDFSKEIAKEKMVYASLSEAIEETLMKEVEAEAKEKIEKALNDETQPWHEATGDQIKEELALKHEEVLTPVIVRGIFDKVAKEIMHKIVLEENRRVDGRKMDEVRPIEIKTHLLPRVHGSAVFQRGSTQVLSIATIGPLSLSQTLEGMRGEETKRFMHHYNMGINPFSVGEVKKIGAPNRRDIGHGNLVEKSLRHILPPTADFPYAVRVVSEVLAANASTSMASLCASTLSLMDAGVKLINPVAGIALGLLSDENKFQVITDMQAVEDFYGEMDFKVSGTVNGVTAIQMDTKLKGLSFEIIEEALKQGKSARELILTKITEAVPEIGAISKYAPKIEITHIKPEDIGVLIGPGGKNINAIISRTGAQIDIEDDGTVMVSSMDPQAIKKALAEINGMFKEVTVGEVYEGKVVRLASFGAFVEIAPGKDGLVHVSQMAPGRVERPEDIVSEGQMVKVRVTDVDQQGKIALSMLFGEDQKPDLERRPGSGGRSYDRTQGKRDFGGDRRPFGRGNRRPYGRNNGERGFGSRDGFSDRRR